MIFSKAEENYRQVYNVFLLFSFLSLCFIQSSLRLLYKYKLANIFHHSMNQNHHFLEFCIYQRILLFCFSFLRNKFSISRMKCEEKCIQFFSFLFCSRFNSSINRSTRNTVNTICIRRFFWLFPLCLVNFLLTLLHFVGHFICWDFLNCFDVCFQEIHFESDRSQFSQNTFLTYIHL
jgi:hypothetical protein